MCMHMYINFMQQQQIPERDIYLLCVLFQNRAESIKKKVQDIPTHREVA